MQRQTRRSPSGNQRFAEAPNTPVQRSTFNRSHGFRATLDGGWLVPIFWDEVLPGDTFELMLKQFTRIQTLVRPVFDNIFVAFYFFFVANRLIYEDWKYFMGEKDNPSDATVYVTPKITSPVGGYANESIYDYFGLPTQQSGIVHLALPLRAYNLIYKEWFRSQDITDSPPINIGSGPDDPADYTLLKRTKPHDYFTSGLPTPQRGPDVLLPLGDTAPVVGIGIPSFASTGGGGASSLINTGALAPVIHGGLAGNLDWGTPNLEADLSMATASTINQIRQSFQIQKFYERAMRGGARYPELIRAFFNVISPDSRLQRPEYLGGGKTLMNVHPLAQTTSTSALGALGDLAAYGTSSSQGMGFQKSFTEHGIIVGLMCVSAEITYQQGLDRKWSRDTRFDYFWPTFAHLGEQEILSKEIYATGGAGDDDVFAYQERYAEYRYAMSRITGKFRSNDALTLDVWHLSQFFASRPVLNDDFILEDPPFDRAITVTNEAQFYTDIWFDLKCHRPIPVYSVPGLVDHF